jgi:PAS domain S-box-containing protein
LPFGPTQFRGIVSLNCASRPERQAPHLFGHRLSSRPRLAMIAVAAVSTACVILAIFLVGRFVFIERYRELQEQAVGEKMERTIRALELTALNLERVAVDWAQWDMSYESMHTGNMTVLSRDLAGAVDSIGVDLMAYIDNAGEVVLLAAEDGSIALGAEADLRMSTCVQATGAELVGMGAMVAGSGVVVSPDGPVLAALNPILRTDASGPSAGVLVVVKRFDRETLDSISGLTGTEIAVYSPDDPGLSARYSWLSGELAWEQAALVRTLDDGVVAGFVGLRDIFGDPALVIEALEDAPEYGEATKAVWIFGSTLTALWLVTAGLTWLLIRRLGISRANLEASERRHRAVVEQSSEGIVLVDRRSGAIVEANRAFCDLSGYGPEEVAGLALAAVFGDPEVFAAGADGQKSDISTVDHRTHCRRKGGDEVEVEMTVSVIRQGSSESLSLAVRDISERIQAQRDLKRKEDQLACVQKMDAVGGLAGGVAHDFNNLLTAIMIGSDLLRGRIDAGDSESLAEVVEIRSAAERGADLCRQLLAYGRRQRMAPALLDINSVVDGVAGMLRRVVGEQIELVLDLGSGLGLVEADRSQMDHVVMNLALNARDAMPRGGKLTLATRELTLTDSHDGVTAAHIHGELRQGRYVALEVSDTGEGMDQAAAERAFEPFFTTKGLGKGTGLGLSVVYGIVTQSGGAVYLDSVPGVGTRSVILLPRVSDGAAGTPEKVKPLDAVQAPAPNETHILVAEDEDTVRRFIVRVLRRAGYEVLEAGSGTEALQLLAAREGPIHLFLSDMVMPGMSGAEAAAGVRQRYPGLPAIIMSGYSEQKTIASDDGSPTLFLQKPFTQDVLLSTIACLLS